MLIIIIIAWILHTLSAPTIIWMCYGIVVFVWFVQQMVAFIKLASNAE